MGGIFLPVISAQAAIQQRRDRFSQTRLKGLSRKPDISGYWSPDCAEMTS